MLFSYAKQVRRLLRDARQDIDNEGDLYDWINIARGQIAGEGECIRVAGTISTVIGTRNYNFSSISIDGSSLLGVAGVIHVRRIAYAVGGGQKWIPPRSWEWMDLYYFNNPVPVNGAPQRWTQYGQGAAGQNIPYGGSTATSGSFYLDPPPDAIYTLLLDCVGYPQALAADTDPEALPYLWTDAVPFFAAYYAFLERQDEERAKQFLSTYQVFVTRARQASNPSVNRPIYEQASDPAQLLKFGVSQRNGQ